MQTAQQNPRSQALEGPLGRYLLEENFRQLVALPAVHAVPSGDSYATAGTQAALNTNPNWCLVGTNAATAGCTRAATGGVTLTTTTSANDQVILSPHTTSGVSSWLGTSWLTSQGVCFETTIVTGASIVATTIIAGLKLTNTPVVATDNDQAYFRYCDTENGGVWQLVISNNNVDLVLATDIAVTASTQYQLRVEVDANLVAHFFINGEEHYPNITTNVVRTAIALIPYVGVQTNTTSAKAINVRGVRCSIN